MISVYRKEIKYVISLTDFYRVQKRLACFLTPDAYGGPDGYRVRSLYFDSITDRDLYDTLFGLMEKRKIRLRIYSPQDERVKLEYKCKSGTDGVKKTLTVSKAQARQMIAGDFSFLADAGDELSRQLYIRLLSGGYSAKSIVEYARRAYLYPAGNVRITFDTQTAGGCVPGAFFDTHPAIFPLLPPDVGVLEVKYTGLLPAIFKEVVAGLDSLATSNSKYAQSRFLY